MIKTRILVIGLGFLFFYYISYHPYIICNIDDWSYDKGEEMKFKMYELSGSDACYAKRRFPFKPEEKTSNHFMRAIIMKGILNELFSGVLSETDAWSELETRFQEVPYPSNEQRIVHAADAYRQIMRYYKAERRFPRQLNAEEIDLGHDMEVLVTPDYCFMSKDSDTIEIVKIKCSRPTVTQRGAYSDIGLYSMLQYGKNLVAEGECKKVIASYYYLSKKNDSYSVDNPKFDLDFFETKGGLNIVSILDTYDKTQPLESTEVDRLFEPVIQKFMEGIPDTECSKDDCEKCFLFDICKYTEPPTAIVKEPVVKSVRDIMLTEDQEKAVEYEKGICRINAGAGAGKTMVVALRVATLLSKGVKPEEIFLVTFTNSGAEEMLSRIKLYVEDFGLDVDLSKLRVQTFNAFGYDIIKENYESLGFTDIPNVIDDVERSHIIADLLNQAVARDYIDPLTGKNGRNPLKNLDFRNFALSSNYVTGALVMTKKVFDVMKSHRYSAGDLSNIKSDLGYLGNFLKEDTLEQIAMLYDEYDAVLRSENLLEFADQEAMVFEVLHEDPFYFERFGFRHIVVDEFQDTSKPQIEILKNLIDCPSFESLMVVGDDAQAIFGFRDTSPEFIIDFERHIGEPIEDIYLLENHRSTPEIIDYANKINAKNLYRIAKELKATREHGKPVVAQGFLTPKEEREYVLAGIKEHLDAGVAPEDIAVICYTKNELLQMSTLLDEESIPSVLLNPEPLCENSRVRAAIALIAAIQDPKDTKDIFTFANAKNGGNMIHSDESSVQTMVFDVNTWLTEYHALENDDAKKDSLMEILHSIDHNDDEVYQKFLQSLERKNLNKLYEYVNEFYLYGSNSAFRRMHDYPGVVLTTAHSSKGLEWPICYNMISKYDSEELKQGRKEVEERRRLLFVSATRARDELYITGQYVAYGKKGNYTYNKYLIDTYEVLGMEFSVSSIEAERAMREEIAKKEREAKKSKNKK